MEFWNAIAPFVYTLLGILSGLALTNFLPSYFGEKGKNIATKEDIAGITKQVEEVKTIFLKETEQLKARLQLNNSVLINLLSEERNSVTAVYERLSVWIDHLSDSGMRGTDRFDNEALNKYILTVDQQFNLLQVAQAKFNLYVEDESLRDELDEVQVIVMDKLIPLLNTCKFDLQRVNLDLEVFRNSGNPVLPGGQHQQLLDEMVDILSDYGNKIVENLPGVSEKLQAFRANCRAYIYKTLQEQEQALTDNI